MGCWDVYCPICGLTLQGLPLKQFIEEQAEICKEVYKKGKMVKINKNKKDIILKKDNIFHKEKLVSKTKWLEKCTILLPNTKPKHNFEEVYCNIGFKKNKELYNISLINNEYDNIGIVLHTDCWKYVKESKKYELTFDDFNLKKIKGDDYWNHYKFKYFNYKEVEKYHEQYFDIDILYKRPQDFYLLYSPMKNTIESKKNKKRIDKNIIKLFKNKPKQRPSPVQSATIFEKGTIMKGSDGYNYKVTTNKKKIKRWIKLNNN